MNFRYFSKQHFTGRLQCKMNEEKMIDAGIFFKSLYGSRSGKYNNKMSFLKDYRQFNIIAFKYKKNMISISVVLIIQRITSIMHFILLMI